MADLNGQADNNYNMRNGLRKSEEQDHLQYYADLFAPSKHSFSPSRTIKDAGPIGLKNNKKLENRGYKEPASESVVLDFSDSCKLIITRKDLNDRIFYLNQFPSFF